MRQALTAQSQQRPKDPTATRLQRLTVWDSDLEDFYMRLAGR